MNHVANQKSSGLMKRLMTRALPVAGIAAAQAVASAEKIQWAELDKTQPVPAAINAAAAWPPSQAVPPVQSDPANTEPLFILRGKR